jgi:glycosidase
MRSRALSPNLVSCALAVWLVGCGTGAQARDVAVSLDEVGGDVWAFERRVAGRAGCREVELARDGLAVRTPVRDGRFAAVVPLAPGPNELRAACVDRSSSEARVRYDVRLRDAPRAVVSVTVIAGAVVLDAGASTPSEASRAPLASVRWSVDASSPLVARDGTPLTDVTSARVELTPPTVDGRYVVRARVVDEAGREDEAGAAFMVEGGRARRVDAHEPPPWVREAVAYGVVPFLYGEPAFEAVTAELPRLASLGVTTLWLSPIYEAPDDDYGYAVTDYFAVRDDWGSLESLRALVDRAHGLGLRVMLDIVPNHTSDRHPYFAHATQHGARSPHHRFYQRDADGEPVHFFDWEHLPNLDYAHPEVRRFVTEAFAFWLRELDVDGFRVDVAWAIEQRAPGFFAELRRELSRIEPDVALVAEASAREPAFVAGGFDAAYDWTDQVGQWAWSSVFDEGRADLAALDAALRASPGLVFRFLDNNDTGARFVTRHGAGLERVASVLLFTAPGVPVLFTGQERGAEYDPYQRETPLAVAPDPARAAHYTALAHLRRREPALTHGELVPLTATPSDRVYAFARVPAEGRPVITVLHFGATATTARVELPPELASRPLERLFGTPGTQGGRARGGALHLDLDPHAAVVLAPQLIENDDLLN